MKVRTLVALSLSLVIATSAVAQEKGAAPPEMTAEQKAMMDAWEKAATPGEPHRPGTTSATPRVKWAWPNCSVASTRPTA